MLHACQVQAQAHLQPRQHQQHHVMALCSGVQRQSMSLSGAVGSGSLSSSSRSDFGSSAWAADGRTSISAAVTTFGDVPPSPGVKGRISPQRQLSASSSQSPRTVAAQATTSACCTLASPCMLSAVPRARLVPNALSNEQRTSAHVALEESRGNELKIGIADRSGAPPVAVAAAKALTAAAAVPMDAGSLPLSSRSQRKLRPLLYQNYPTRGIYA